MSIHCMLVAPIDPTHRVDMGEAAVARRIVQPPLLLAEFCGKKRDVFLRGDHLTEQETE